jgi:outer membrane receptor for ferrienterochelin and colicin
MTLKVKKANFVRVVAQIATQPTDNVQEMVVTFEKRTERIQAVAASVVAVSGQQLQLLSATSYADYLNTIRGVSSANNDGFEDRISIRSLGETLGSQALASTGLFPGGLHRNGALRDL